MHRATRIWTVIWCSRFLWRVRWKPQALFSLRKAYVFKGAEFVSVRFWLPYPCNVRSCAQSSRGRCPRLGVLKGHFPVTTSPARCGPASANARCWDSHRWWWTAVLVAVHLAPCGLWLLLQKPKDAGQGQALSFWWKPGLDLALQALQTRRS